MRYTKKDQKNRRNNSGSAMVTIIVVVAFVTILATTLLYISSMNYQIKQTDYKNKKSFYSGETYMEKIKVQLMRDVSEASAKAYNDTMTEYASLGTGDLRRAAYYQRFEDNLEEIWDARGDWETWLNNSIVAGTPNATFELESDLDTTNGSTTLAADIVDMTHKDDAYYIIRGIKFTYMDTTGHTSIISTSFYVSTPAFNWDVDRASTTPTAETDPTVQLNLSDCVRYVNWEKK